jgi:hypothetical protein
MSQIEWPQSPIEIIKAYEARRSGRGEIGALILWATWTVEGLVYLDELDELHYQDRLPFTIKSPDIVNMSHIRWATSSAITALDLCAAALGREFCRHSSNRELDLRDFDISKSNNKGKTIALRSKISLDSLDWIDSVLGDQRYKDVHGARNPLTHSRLKRHFYISGPSKTSFRVEETDHSLTTRQLVSHARDLATDRVTEFLQIVTTLP